MKKKIMRATACVCMVTVCLPLVSCSLSTSGNKKVDKEKEQKAFEAFTDELFTDEVQADSITLNYTVANPENYGVTDFTPTMGKFGVEAAKEALAKAENVNKKLDDFDYKALTEEQQLTYDILRASYEVKGDEEDFFLYGEELGSATGIQAQLPILLSEYNVEDKDDLDDYIELLPTVEDYFAQIEEFEQQKSDAGLFMSDRNADNIISQCEDFIKNPNKNLWITIFNDRVDSYDWLTEAEKKSYKKQNAKAVKGSVIPAYKNLIEKLKELKGTGKQEGGVGNLPDGKKYYEELAQSISGSDKTVEEMKKALDATMQQCATKMMLLLKADSSLEEAYTNMEFPMTDPDEILEYLTEEVKKDFPDLGDINYEVKYVDKSLEDHVSPAFYLTPQLDHYTDNSIYINGAKDNDLSKIFPTLAHEGYPGHLLQNVYFTEQKPSPIRALLHYGGYSEGWATYCELYSYDIAGLEGKLGEFAKQYQILNLCLYAKMDIGVNYDCWSEDDLAEYLKGFGVEDKKAITQIFDIVVDDPANYLQYVIGYIEFAELRTEAEKELGDKFDAKKFHTFLLDIGAAPFSIIVDRMQDWMKEQK